MTVIIRYPDGETVSGIVVEETTAEVGRSYPTAGGDVYEYTEVPAYRVRTADGIVTVATGICEVVE